MITYRLMGVIDMMHFCVVLMFSRSQESRDHKEILLTNIRYTFSICDARNWIVALHIIKGTLATPTKLINLIN